VNHQFRFKNGDTVYLLKEVGNLWWKKPPEDMRISVQLPCPACFGNPIYNNPSGQEIKCHNCNGSGVAYKFVDRTVVDSFTVEYSEFIMSSHGDTEEKVYLPSADEDRLFDRDADWYVKYFDIKHLFSSKTEAQIKADSMNASKLKKLVDGLWSHGEQKEVTGG